MCTNVYLSPLSSAAVAFPLQTDPVFKESFPGFARMRVSHEDWISLKGEGQSRQGRASRKSSACSRPGPRVGTPRTVWRPAEGFSFPARSSRARLSLSRSTRGAGKLAGCAIRGAKHVSSSRLTVPAKSWKASCCGLTPWRASDTGCSNKGPHRLRRGQSRRSRPADPGPTRPHCPEGSR